MYAVALIFGVPMLVAGAMIDPEGLHLRGLVTYAAIMLVLLPFAGGWQLLAAQLVLPTAGRSRLGAMFSLWIGGTLTAVAVISWIGSVLDYPRPGAKVDPSGHVLIPFMPRAGLAIGLFGLCMLVSCGLWGGIAAVVRPEVAISGAVISGVLLFGFLYSVGWWLVLT
jgi:hypothetical protein